MHIYAYYAYVYTPIGDNGSKGIMTGSLKGGLAGAVWGAVGAFAAYTGAELAGKLHWFHIS